MKRTLSIEWKHIGNDVTGTCERCSLTGSAIRDVLADLGPYFAERGITPEFRETVLPDEEIGASNQIVIDGRPLEDYLAEAEVVRTPCCSCACITGQDEEQQRWSGRPAAPAPASRDRTRLIAVRSSMEAGATRR
jgi:hypothetical protein